MAQPKTPKKITTNKVSPTRTVGLPSFPTWSPRPLDSSQTARVFISSKNEYPLKRFAGDESTLSDYRKHLTDEIKRVFPFLTVDINEKWLASGAGSPRSTTEDRARLCDVFIGILVDDYGFLDQTGLSATQIEFEAALQASPEKMLIFIQQSLQDSNGQAFKKMPAHYQKLISDLQTYKDGKIVNFFGNWDELSDLILNSLIVYCADTIRAIRRMPAYASNKSTEETSWEQMTFRERHEVMLESFKEGCPGFSLPSRAIDKVSHDEQVLDPQRYLIAIRLGRSETLLPVVLSACPDRFSYPDAAGYVGYPFRTRVESWNNELGPLDVILFFRTATDSQIRRHLGNPDIRVTKEDWGYFACDPERYIQAAYLLNCRTSRGLENRVLQFLSWLVEYEQLETLISWAKVRGLVLEAENRGRQTGSK
jgi:hypothetical protein